MNFDGIPKCYWPTSMLEDESFTSQKSDKVRKKTRNLQTYVYDDDLTDLENMYKEAITSNLSNSKMRRLLKDIGNELG